MKVLTVCDDIGKAKELERSLVHFDYEFDIIKREWKGWSTKLYGVYDFLKNNNHITEFIFVDAYDTFFLSSEFKPIYKNLVSSEVNCWTGFHNKELENKFPETKTPFRYPNSGAYYMQSDFFIKIFEADTPNESDDDQEWLLKQVLLYHIPIDTECKWFQSLCGVSDSDFEIKDNRLTSNITRTTPIIIHGNGKAKMDFYYNLI